MLSNQIINYLLSSFISLCLLFHSYFYLYFLFYSLPLSFCFSLCLHLRRCFYLSRYSLFFLPSRRLRRRDYWCNRLLSMEARCYVQYSKRWPVPKQLLHRFVLLVGLVYTEVVESVGRSALCTVTYTVWCDYLGFCSHFSTCFIDRFLHYLL